MNEDLWDIGWYSKPNAILNMDFDQSDGKHLDSQMEDDSEFIANKKNANNRSPEQGIESNGATPGFPLLVDLNCRYPKKVR